MDGIHRVLIGALGGVSAILAKYIAQDHSFVSHWANLHDPRFFDILVGYAILTPILIFLGAVVAGFSDETNKLKLLAIGVAAPAMITTMAGGANLPAASTSHAPGPAGWNLQWSPFASAFASGTSTRVAQANILEKGVGAFFGGGKGEQRYWVIAGSFKERADAEALATRINQLKPDLKAFVGKKAPNNEYYPVMVGDFVPLTDATRLRDTAVQIPGAEQAYLSTFPDRRP